MKTIAAMMLGFALGAVGLDKVTGQLRLTFGFNQLLPASTSLSPSSASRHRRNPPHHGGRARLPRSIGGDQPEGGAAHLGRATALLAQLDPLLLIGV